MKETPTFKPHNNTYQIKVDIYNKLNDNLINDLNNRLTPYRIKNKMNYIPKNINLNDLKNFKANIIYLEQLYDKLTNELIKPSIIK